MLSLMGVFLRWKCTVHLYFVSFISVTLAEVPLLFVSKFHYVIPRLNSIMAPGTRKATMADGDVMPEQLDRFM